MGPFYLVKPSHNYCNYCISLFPIILSIPVKLVTVRLWRPVLQWRPLGVLMWPVGGYVRLRRGCQVDLWPVCGHFWLDVVQWCFWAECGHFGQLRLVLVDKSGGWGGRLLGGAFTLSALESKVVTL